MWDLKNINWHLNNHFIDTENLKRRWHSIVISRFRISTENTFLKLKMQTLRNTTYIFQAPATVQRRDHAANLSSLCSGGFCPTRDNKYPHRWWEMGKGGRWKDIVSDNEILLLVRPYLKMDGKRATHFGELCKWNLVKSNSPRASLTLCPLFPFWGIKFGVNVAEARKVERGFVRVDFHSNLVCEEFAKL